MTGQDPSNNVKVGLWIWAALCHEVHAITRRDDIAVHVLLGVLLFFRPIFVVHRCTVDHPAQLRCVHSGSILTPLLSHPQGSLRHLLH
jgi:hypothetical protein